MSEAKNGHRHRKAFGASFTCSELTSAVQKIQAKCAKAAQNNYVRSGLWAPRNCNV